MAKEQQVSRATADLLAEWRAAGRDTVAARGAARVAAKALEAATAADDAATEVERAAKAALESVERARNFARKARSAAAHATEAATVILAEAEGGKVRANHDVEVAEHAEADARDAFHAAEGEAYRKSDGD